eukprot:4479955-Amphidinium_carterae.3
MQIVRPLSDEEATAPKGEQVKLDWLLTSLACGLEEVSDLKPDHVAVRLPKAFQPERLSPGFQGEKSYEEPQITDKIE